MPLQQCDITNKRHSKLLNERSFFCFFLRHDLARKPMVASNLWSSASASWVLGLQARVTTLLCFWNSSLFSKMFQPFSTLAALCPLRLLFSFSALHAPCPFFRLLFLVPRPTLLLFSPAFVQLSPSFSLPVMKASFLRTPLLNQAPGFMFYIHLCVALADPHVHKLLCSHQHIYTWWQCKNHWNWGASPGLWTQGPNLCLSFATSFVWSWASSFPLGGLDFEYQMFPKGPWVEGLVPNPWCYWEVMEPLGDEA
jgi:hypothetical protein